VSDPSQHDQSWCADLPHPLVTISVHLCPHRREVIAWVTTGTTDAPVLGWPYRFGPFDDPDETVATLELLLAQKVGWMLAEDP
jgi:hypothetical protein